MKIENLKSLVVDDTQYNTKLNTKFENRKKYTPKNEKHIIAFIPGTIREIYVKQGQQVSKTQDLLVLEAMKMRNTIKAPFSGTIKKIYAKTDGTVPKGELLLEFE
jgi:biotin carboxyl carrier protein